jgi:glutaminyl-tRNA synthetase
VLGKRVRLRNAYVIEAVQAIKNADGDIIAVEANIIEGTLGRDPEDGVKPKGVIHWVDAAKNVQFAVRLYERLFNDPSPDSGDKDFLQFINPASLLELPVCFGEPGLAFAEAERALQFEREGYFCRDSRAEGLVFNRTITLKDSFKDDSKDN